MNSNECIIGIVMMQTKRKIVSLIALAIVLPCAGAFGAGPDETSSQNILPLGEAFEINVRTNPEIQEALSNYRSVLAERSVATSEYWPKIGTELSGGPESTKGPGTDDKQQDLTGYSATLYARQNLFNGGGTTAFVKETDSRIRAAAYEVLNVANVIFLETAEAYINILLSAELLEYAKVNVNAQERILEQVREKTASGFSRVSDLYNAESRLALSRANFISQQQDLNQAVVQFHRQLGRFVQPQSLVRPKPAFIFPQSVEKAVAIAFGAHPALKVADSNIQVRKYSYERAEAAYWPTLDLEVQGGHLSDTDGIKGEADRASAMLRLNYTFFDGGLREGVKGKNYGSLKKEYERSYIERRNVNRAVRLAWNVYEAEKHKQKFLEEHIAMSAKTLDAFKEEYFIGRRTLLDLLNMENEHYSAKNAGAQSAALLLVGYYRLSQTTGILLQEYDTGLRKMLAVSLQDDFDLEGFEGLNRNVDDDSVQDRQDQCDNSVEGEPTLASGCRDNDVVSYGYQVPETLAPYINPEEQIPPEMELPIDMQKKEQSFHLETIYFESYATSLTEPSQLVLEKIAAQLKKLDGYTIEIIGHTDNTGSENFNQELSLERAQSVYEALVQLGVNEDDMLFSGMGELEPVATNETEAGKRKNRRIEFKLIKK